MKIKNILYGFIAINIVITSDIHAMEQPNKQQTEKFSRSAYSYDQDLLNLRLVAIKNGQDLLKAMRAEDKNKARRLLNEPYIATNITDEFGSTSLMYAACYNYFEIVQILLDKGANPNIQGKDGTTALHWAVTYNNPEIVQILVDRGANLKIKNKCNHTALDVALMGKNQAIINILIANEKLNCIVC